MFIKIDDHNFASLFLGRLEPGGNALLCPRQTISRDCPEKLKIS